MSDLIYGGVEGGGSNTIIVIVGGNGQILSKIENNESNCCTLIGMENCKRRIFELVQEAKEKAELDSNVPLAGLGLSMSGCEESTIVQIPAQAQVPMSSSNASGRSLMSAASEVTPPNVTVASAGSPQVWDNKSDKKDRKEKEVLGLMKRFASKKKCKSPPPSAYLMDNPVFVDCVTGGHQAQTTVTVSSSHSRSESCPSEVVFDVGPGHKKTNSLDVDGDKQNVKCQHAKYPAPLVRERFRCIVPYPPNSEYELELRVGDIIYVHKKREDGWFKGTLQRTGKTGLFPGSFVETF